MRNSIQDARVKYYIGDVRNYTSILDAMEGVDFLFHAAALKQVPSCEFYPMEAVRTNIQGTENVLRAAKKCNIKRAICLSTDKAVYPINAMGISKAMMEKVMVSMSRTSHTGNTIFSGTRYGNVMCSRGSVIPKFVDQIKKGEAITITDPNMTRFIMSLDQAVELVLFAFTHGNSGDIFVQKAPSSTMRDLAEAIKQIMNKPDHPVTIIGTRHGEKLFETLLTREEMTRALDMGEYYRIPMDERDLNYTGFFNDGNQSISDCLDYNSHNTKRLGVPEIKEILYKLPYIQELLEEGKFA